MEICLYLHVHGSKDGDGWLVMVEGTREQLEALRDELNARVQNGEIILAVDVPLCIEEPETVRLETPFTGCELLPLSAARPMRFMARAVGDVLELTLQ
jgi:hypothetical protein